MRPTNIITLLMNTEKLDLPKNEIHKHYIYVQASRTSDAELPPFLTFITVELKPPCQEDSITDSIFAF
ncbi:hypothetical protein C0J52_11501 [Blattella germanica]|nr:hypothetical protein C0J52_11501 [Blattella germanica]